MLNDTLSIKINKTQNSKIESVDWENLPFGKVFSVELSGDNNKQLFVPRGFLHGFSVLEDDTIVSYKCDNYYYPEAEDGVMFNDLDLNIDWKLPIDKLIVSQKDLELDNFKNQSFSF